MCRLYIVISPDDGHSRPKHVEKRNKHIKKNCAASWLYLQDYTEMHGQQNKISPLMLFTLFVLTSLTMCVAFVCNSSFINRADFNSPKVS
jgi:hypothetical protein